MSKVHIYSPIIYDMAFFQTLKRNYAVNGHEMYCTCVFFYLCVAHIWTRTVTELPNSRVGVKYSTCTWYLYLSTYLSVLDVLEYLVYGNVKVLVLVLVLDQKVLGTYK